MTPEKDNTNQKVINEMIAAQPATKPFDYMDKVDTIMHGLPKQVSLVDLLRFKKEYKEISRLVENTIEFVSRKMEYELLISILDKEHDSDEERLMAVFAHYISKITACKTESQYRSVVIFHFPAIHKYAKNIKK